MKKDKVTTIAYYDGPFLCSGCGLTMKKVSGETLVCINGYIGNNTPCVNYLIEWDLPTVMLKRKLKVRT